MAMFQKSEYDSLKELNLTPDQIKEALKAKVDLEAKVTKQGEDLTKAQSELTAAANSFNEVKTRLDSLEANPRKEKKDDERPPKTSFLDNEDAAFDERFNERAGPMARVTLEAARNTARMSARIALDGQYLETAGGRIPLLKLWDKWGSEIDKAAGEVQLSALGNTQTWLNLLDYVIGKHSRELLGKTSEFVESVQSHGNVRIGDKEEPDKPNDEEATAIAKMNKYSGGRLTPEKYTEIKNKMKFVNV
jgi:hypothetical protein